MSLSYKKILQLSNKCCKLWNCQNSKFVVTHRPHHGIFYRNISIYNNLHARISFNLSDIGEGIKEVVIREWFVKVGDKVSQFDNICEVQSDKASVTITSRYDGIISKLHYEVDETALVGKPLVEIETEENDPSVVTKPESTKEKPNLTQTAETSGDKPAETSGDESSESDELPLTDSKDVQQDDKQTVLCIPSVRRLAKEYNINLSQVKGTGKHGRILKEDVLRYLDKPKTVTEAETISIRSLSEENRTEPIKGFQKAMVKTMTDSLKIPHFVYSDEIIVTKLSEIRKSLKSSSEIKDLKISFLPFFVKAVSFALKQYPLLNSSVDDACENVTYYKNHNIGVAMATKVGLAVPVLKKVEDLSIVEIANELNRLIKSGREGKFLPDDLTGGTFSISNIGSIGGTYTKPVILPPQVVIIALGASQVLPRFDKDGNVIREEILNISCAADHRVIDGATVASFIQVLKKQIENPMSLFLNI